MKGSIHPQIWLAALSLLFVFYDGCIAESSRISNVRGDIYESGRITQELDAAGLKKMVFKTSGNFAGVVTVTAADEGHGLSYVKHFKAGSIEQAEMFSNHITVEVERIGEDIIVQAIARYDAPWQGTNQSARVEIEAVLPKSADAELKTDFFDITVEGPFSKVDISNKYGVIKVSGVTEALRLDTKNSRVTLADLQGHIDVSTSNNWLRAREIDTKGNKAVFRNEYGVIEISRFSGVLECTTSYEEIDLSGIRLGPGSSRITNRYGSIDAAILGLDEARLHLSNHFSNVELTLPESLKADFDIGIDKGEIHMTGIPVFPTQVEKDRLIASTEHPVSAIFVKITGIGAANIKGRKLYGGP